MTIFDIAVVGAGVAGMRAAATAATQGMACILIDPMCGGGELMNLGALHDVSGDAAQTGPDYAAELLAAVTDTGVELAFGTVTSMAHGTHWILETQGERYAARAVIIASGLAPGRLGLANEGMFEGRGLSHCAACDGPLHRGSPVAVVGGNRWAVQEAMELTAFSPSVTLIADAKPLGDLTGIRFVAGRVVDLHGESELDAVSIARDGQVERLATSGLFVQANRTAALGFAPKELAVKPDGSPHADASHATNLPLVYVAGSLRKGALTTIEEADTDGWAAALAALAALEAQVQEG